MMRAELQSERVDARFRPPHTVLYLCLRAQRFECGETYNENAPMERFTPQWRAFHATERLGSCDSPTSDRCRVLSICYISQIYNRKFVVKQDQGLYGCKCMKRYQCFLFQHGSIQHFSSSWLHIPVQQKNYVGTRAFQKHVEKPLVRHFKNAHKDLQVDKNK